VSSETININVVIADRPYRLRIKPEEEEYVRLAAKTIKEKIKELQTMYEAKDKQDYLAMTALMYCVDILNQKASAENELNNFNGKITELDGILSEFLKN